MDFVSLPIFLFVLAAASLGIGALVVGSLLGPKRTGAVKQMPYESGMDPIHDARRRFDVRFYLVAIVFLIFDVELLFLYPWAVASKNPQGLDRVVDYALSQGVDFGRGLVFAEVMFFLTLLTLGLVYVWRKGVFQWR